MMYTEEVYISLLTETHKHTQLLYDSKHVHSTDYVRSFQYIWAMIDTHANVRAFVANILICEACNTIVSK